MKEMMYANLGQFMGRSLLFGALLTKIFKHFRVRLVGDKETKISSAISKCTLTHTSGADNLMGSLNAYVPPDDAPEDLHANAIPSTEQPQYWTEFLVMEEEQHNQRVRWEQQIAN
ncbi:hypothetical protein ACSBR1_032605 [Camellia fascicularis]